MGDREEREKHKTPGLVISGGLPINVKEHGKFQLLVVAHRIWPCSGEQKTRQATQFCDSKENHGYRFNRITHLDCTQLLCILI